MTHRRTLLTGLLALLVGAAGGLAQEPAPLLASDDQIVFIRNNDLYIVSAEGRDLRQLTSDADRELSASASPDGSLLVYEAFDAVTNEFGLFTLALSGGSPQRIVAVGHSPAWSPDGGRLVYTANVVGGYEVFVCDKDGRNIHRLTDTPSSELYPVWSPDGTRLAYLRELYDEQLRNQAVIVRDALGGENELTTLVDMQVTKLAWAPGDSLLLSARTTDGTARDGLYLIAPEGGKPKLLTEGLDGETAGSWAANGAIICSRLTRTTSEPVLRRLDGSGQSLPGTQLGDMEPCYVPGASHRAPTVYVRNRRSYYLPAPIIVDDDVLLPLADLATQLGWAVTNTGGTFQLSLGETTLTIDPVKGSIETGDQPVLLNPVPRLIGPALMVPVRALADRLQAKAQWDQSTRILRIDPLETNDASPEQPAAEPDPPGDPEPGVQ